MNLVVNESIHNEHIQDDKLNPNQQVIIESGGDVVLEGPSADSEAFSGVIDDTTVPVCLSISAANVGGPVIPNTTVEV